MRREKLFAVNWLLVWEAASQDTPTLQRRIAEILADEFSE